ncbi:MAG: roadblock/LC7 domain-containing protein [Candidatus Thermoplasmatota archaeon]|nr:roadblock/LC7 domain-containing protein [Candidatus Thermoplasmatota archaeon]
MALEPEIEAGVSPEDDLDAETTQERLVNEMTDALRSLEANTKGVFGSAVVDRHGFPIAWDLKGGTQQSSVGLLGATLRLQLLRASTTLDLGDFVSGLIKFEKGYLGVFEIGADDLFVVILAGSQVNTMDLLLETDAVLRDLKAILGSG